MDNDELQSIFRVSPMLKLELNAAIVRLFREYGHPLDPEDLMSISICVPGAHEGDDGPVPGAPRGD